MFLWLAGGIPWVLVRSRLDDCYSKQQPTFHTRFFSKARGQYESVVLWAGSVVLLCAHSVLVLHGKDFVVSPFIQGPRCYAPKGPQIHVLGPKSPHSSDGSRPSGGVTGSWGSVLMNRESLTTTIPSNSMLHFPVCHVSIQCSPPTTHPQVERARAPS